MREFDIISLGSIYLDVVALNFPIHQALAIESETVGGQYQLAAGGSAVISCRIAAQLGLRPLFIGKVGQDGPGQIVQDSLHAQHIAAQLITDETVQTNLGINYVAPDGKTLMTVVGSANQALKAQEVMLKLEELLPRARFLYLGGYFKLKQLHPVIEKIIELAHQSGAKVILDHGRITNTITDQQVNQLKQIITSIDYYFPSQDEFSYLWGAQLPDALSTLGKQTQAVIAVKCAEKGCIGLDEQRNILEQPAFTVTPLDTVGAGDSFNAGFIKGVIDGLSFGQTLEFACATAAAKISSIQPISITAVQGVIQSGKAYA